MTTDDGSLGLGRSCGTAFAVLRLWLYRGRLSARDIALIRLLIASFRRPCALFFHSRAVPTARALLLPCKARSRVAEVPGLIIIQPTPSKRWGR